MRHSDTELCEELRRLADETGKAPTLQDVREHGEYAAMTYYNRFGSWRKALDEAGFEPREPNSRVATDELIEEIQQVAKEHGSPPSAADMNEHGEYWVSTYRRRFDSWNDAIKAAGYEPNPESTKIPESALLDEIRRLAAELDTKPTFDDMTKKGNYGTETYIRRFGSWSKAVDTALNNPR